MRFRLPRVSAVSALIAGSFVALAVCNVVTSSRIPVGSGLKGVGIITLPFAVVGLIVARRRPRNSIGWVLLALAFAVLVSVNAANYAVLVYRVGDRLPLGRLAVALAPAWVPPLVLAPLPIVLFPDGRIPAGRWAGAFWGYVGLAVAFLATIGVGDSRAFTDRRLVIDPSGSLSSLTAPPHGAAAVLNTLAIVGYGVCVAAMVAYQIVCFRRSSGEERQQRKWFLLGGAIAVSGLIVATQSNTLGFMFAAVLALPLGIGFGILKYRLYDIDRLISRTLSYAIVTAALVGVFAGLVLLSTRVLPFSSPVGVAAATLAAAALFNPLRRRVQHLVDRRFNRARYDAEGIASAFRARLRQAVDLDAVEDELLDAVSLALAPSLVSVWIKPTS